MLSTQDVERLVQQIRALNQKVDANHRDVVLQVAAVNQAIGNIPVGAIINMAQNSDLSFNEHDYRPATFATSSDRPYDWYARAANLTTAFTENIPGTESPEAIKRIWSAGCTMAATSKDVVSDTAIFSADSVGMNFVLLGAGPGGDPLVTVVDVFTDSTHATMHDAATGDVAGTLGRLFPTADTLWNGQKGFIELGGGDCIASAFNKLDITPGLRYFLQCQAKVNIDEAGVTGITGSHRLQASFWENANHKIIEGEAFDLRVSLVSGAGAVGRHYILKVIDENGDFYYSNVASPAAITGTPDPGSGSPGEVLVEWPALAGLSEVHLLRSDTVEGLTDYFDLITIRNGATDYRDKGGRPGSPSTPTARNPRAAALFKNFGTQLGNGAAWILVTWEIRVPSKYNLAGSTSGKQYVRFEIVDEDNNAVAIASRGILIDKVGVAITRGQYAPSPDDRLNTAPVISVTPDPLSGDPGPQPGKGRGGGPLETF